MVGGKFTKQREKHVKALQLGMVQNALELGRSVIIADTNLNPARREYWQGVAKNEAVHYEERSFLNVPVEECIRRDLLRHESVGKDVIYRMYRQHVKPIPKPPPSGVHKGNMPVYIFDLDGTLAHMDGRSPYEWDKVSGDLPNPYLRRIMFRLSMDTEIIILSGRDEVCRDKTIAWLNACGMSSYSKLYMRPQGDMRKDTIVKEEMYVNHIQGKYHVVGVFDDRPSVCRMWRELGLPVFQVGDPDVDF